MNDDSIRDLLKTPEERRAAAEPFIAALATQAKAPAPLFEIEDDLAALLNSEDSVPEEQEQAFRLELEKQLRTAVQKRDRVGEFIKHCENEAENTAKEIKRLTARKRIFENAGERLRGYATGTILALGPDDKGKNRKLKGSKFTLSIRELGSAVELTDESRISKAFKRVRVDMPAETWEFICALEKMPQPVPIAAYYVDGAVLKMALEVPGPCPDCKATGNDLFDRLTRQECKSCNGTGILQIPGAKLVTGRYSLVLT